jgi:hypothetical protein
MILLVKGRAMAFNGLIVQLLRSYSYLRGVCIRKMPILLKDIENYLD